jgi:putative oxidoreductase
LHILTQFKHIDGSQIYDENMRKLHYRILSLGNVNIALLIGRIGISAMMLTHGYPKLMRLVSGEPITFATVFGLSATLSLVLAVFAEFFCSIFVIIGYYTRLAVIPLIATMAVAAFYIHGDDPFSAKEKSLLFLLFYVMLLLTGAGKYSVDHLVLKKKKKKQRRYIG